MIILQLLLYCLLFTVMVKLFVIGGAINGLYFYPKEVQDRAIALGMTDRETVSRKRKWFMTVFCLVMFIALVLIIGVWNGVSAFGTAYWQALLFLEVMNIYDGVVIDKLWVGYKDVPQLVNTGFQVLFHSPPGVLFTFPSQYYALSVTEEYLALEGGPSCFPQGFPCLVVLWILPASHQFRLRDFHPL